jgi:Na+/H+ antiporter NhaD/arsenite permease-like protein
MLSFLKRWGITNPWVWVYLVTTSLQVFRGSPIDTLIFGGSTLIVWLDAAGFFKRNLRERPRIRNSIIAVVMLVLGITLSFFPRHTYFQGSVMIAILPVALYLVWHRDRGPKEKADKIMTRTKLVWTIFCLFVCVWEFSANIQGQLENSLYTHPTISVLIDPFMDNTIGQTVFVVLWLFLGVGLLRVWGRK